MHFNTCWYDASWFVHKNISCVQKYRNWGSCIYLYMNEESMKMTGNTHIPVNFLLGEAPLKFLFCYAVKLHRRIFFNISYVLRYFFDTNFRLEKREKIAATYFWRVLHLHKPVFWNILLIKSIDIPDRSTVNWHRLIWMKSRRLDISLDV